VLVHDPADPAELAAALESLLADPERAERLGQAGRRRVHAHFLDDRQLRQRAELYARLADR
jgi:glycosyltransferase involved in cell wall biosynthesis